MPTIDGACRLLDASCRPLDASCRPLAPALIPRALLLAALTAGLCASMASTPATAAMTRPIIEAETAAPRDDVRKDDVRKAVPTARRSVRRRSSRARPASRQPVAAEIPIPRPAPERLAVISAGTEGGAPLPRTAPDHPATPAAGGEPAQRMHLFSFVPPGSVSPRPTVMAAPPSTASGPSAAPPEVADPVPQEPRPVGGALRTGLATPNTLWVPPPGDDGPIGPPVPVSLSVLALVAPAVEPDAALLDPNPMLPPWTARRAMSQTNTAPEPQPATPLPEIKGVEAKGIPLPPTRPGGSRPNVPEVAAAIANADPEPVGSTGAAEAGTGDRSAEAESEPATPPEPEQQQALLTPPTPPPAPEPEPEEPAATALRYRSVPESLRTMVESLAECSLDTANTTRQAFGDRFLFAFACQKQGENTQRIFVLSQDEIGEGANVLMFPRPGGGTSGPYLHQLANPKVSPSKQEISQLSVDPDAKPCRTEGRWRVDARGNAGLLSWRTAASCSGEMVSAAPTVKKTSARATRKAARKAKRRRR